ncbi:MAG: squalene synthase HpnC [Armatimonadetes bacterium]|nr:squalene synthase HpnC [Armatimonadota bacterium]
MVADTVIERYRLVEQQPLDLPEAQQFCAELTSTHYENFTVVSWFLPRELRQHFANVYAYCRVSDDLADEISGDSESLAWLERWRGALRAMYAGEARHPVFVALWSTVQRFDIPCEPFEHLLDAFVQDRHQTRYATYSDLLDYCRRSADPVGRLVLYLGGYRDELRQRLSDYTCTALQLTNFWQDVRRDYAKGRVYLPQEDLAQFGVDEQQIAHARCDEAWRALLRFEVERTRELFRAGLPLLDMLDGHLRRDVALFSAGGWRILDLIARQDYDTLTSRPALGKLGKVSLMLRLLVKGGTPWRF